MDDPKISWKEDALDRKKYADILTKTLVEQSTISANTRGGGLTIALDGDWGSGKTFFIKRWAKDLISNGYPAIVFDAWENDVGDETSIVLMSMIKKAIENNISESSSPQELLHGAKTKLTTSAKALRKAILPTSKIIAKGLIKKATGIAVDDILNELGTSDANNLEFDSKSIDNTLDQIFNQSLHEHEAKKEAINAFKSILSEVILELETLTETKLPIFIFIDEVDRCKPTYAISLLEEIKHLFGVTNACFIVSTNFDQLKESISAVYGNNFDGHRYLKRFFDRNYTIPEPDNNSFAGQLISDESPLSSRNIITGLPDRPKIYTAIECISLIATGSSIDLRSQKQIFNLVIDVASCISNKQSIHLLWLYFLCATFHKSPDTFRHLSNPELDHNEFRRICENTLINKQYVRSIEPDGRSYGNSEFRNTEIIDILWVYYSLSSKDLKNIHEESYKINIYDYPRSIAKEISNELPSTYQTDKSYPPSIHQYFDLVKAAGVLVDVTD